MALLLKDVQYALRGLCRSPAFSLVALLVLALGTGVNATVFSFVNALLLRPAAVPDPGSLVSIYTSDFSSGAYGTSSYPDLLSLKEGAASSFATLAAHDGGRAILLQAEGAVERIRASGVTEQFFDTLRIQPQIGRLLGGADFAPGAPPAAVITDELWRRTFNAVPDILSRPMIVDGVAVDIAGVLPRSFTGLDLGARVDAWVPWSDPKRAADRGSRGLMIVGRLQPGGHLDTAQAQVSSIAERLAHEYPETNRGTLTARDRARGMTVLRHTRMPPTFRAEVTMISSVMVAAAVLVLLIACANVASLLLSRGIVRSREVAVRLALGASRFRLLRYMLLESLLLGAGGAALGLLFGLWTSDALPSFFPADQAAMLEAGVDGRVLTYTMVVALAGSLAFGIAPAVQTLRSSIASAVLRSGAGATTTGSGTRLRTTLVVGQVALATVLSISATLLVSSLLNSLDAYLGFGTRDAVIAYLEQPQSRAATRGIGYYRTAVERANAIPGVSAAAVGRFLPLAGAARRRFTPDGYRAQPGEDLELNINIVDANYFRAMQIPLLAGRTFDSSDLEAATAPAIVNDTLAHKYFNGEAVGRRMTDSQGMELTIVGVVNTGKHRSLHEAPLPVVYYLLDRSYVNRAALVARATNASALMDTVRRELASVDPGVAVYRVTTMKGHIGEALVTDRMTAALVSICGALALVLAIVGVYGVVAFAVSRRSREIGVRVALGATPRQIVGLVLREGLRVTALGTAVGLVGAVAAVAALSSLLFGIGASAVGTVAAVPVALGAITVAAALLPARHALRLNPIAVLRQE